jgi:hypothetical protein
MAFTLHGAIGALVPDARLAVPMTDLQALGILLGVVVAGLVVALVGRTTFSRRHP